MITRTKLLPVFAGLYSFVFLLKIPGFFLSGSISLATNTLAYLLLFAIGIKVFHGDFIQEGSWISENKLKSSGIIILGYIGINLANILPFLLISQIGQAGSLTNDSAVVEAIQQLSPAISILILGIVGPVVEEFFYRKLLIPGFSRYVPTTIAIVFSSLLFAIAHLSWGFEIGEVVLIIPHFFNGIVLGILFQKTKKLIFPILLHVALNMMALLPLVLS